MTLQKGGQAKDGLLQQELQSLAPAQREKYDAFCRIGEEVNEKLELVALLKEDRVMLAYDGFEPSGRIHVAQALLKAVSVNRMARCGCRSVIYVADWFALLNNKCGGDIEGIRKLGNFFIGIWKASGMDLSSVEFVWAADLIEDKLENKSEQLYWETVLQVARSHSLKRL